MHIERIEDERVWDHPLEQLPQSQLLQSWWWGVFQQTLGRDVARFHLLENGESVAALQLVRHPLPLGLSYLYAPRGPVPLRSGASLIDATTLRDIPAQLSSSSAPVFMRLEPSQEGVVDPSCGPAVPTTQPAHEYAVALAGDEESLFRAMHEKTRYNIKLAARHGVRSRVISDVVFARRVFPRLWELFNSTAKRQRIRLHPRHYYERMIEVLMPKGKLHLALADRGDHVVAAHLLSAFGDTVTFLHGGASYDDRQHMAPHLLHWDGMKFAKKIGAQLYNFGGVSPLDATNHPWQNLTRFKEGFGAIGESGRRLDFPVAHDAPLRPRWYALYTQVHSLRRRR